MYLMFEERHRMSYRFYLKLCRNLFRKGMEKNYFNKNETKLCSDRCGAPSADEEVTAASLVMMYADHPGDITATSR